MKIRVKIRISKLIKNLRAKVTHKHKSNWEVSNKAQANKGKLKSKSKLKSLKKETKGNLELK